MCWSSLALHTVASGENVFKRLTAICLAARPWFNTMSVYACQCEPLIIVKTVIMPAGGASLPNSAGSSLTLL